MIRRALLLLSVSTAIYLLVKKTSREDDLEDVSHAADAEWANEGGANAPETV
jgi:hypothetical protein